VPLIYVFTQITAALLRRTVEQKPGNAASPRQFRE
jgi:hypothetical protein